MTVLTPEMRRWRLRVFVATWAGYAGYYFCRKPFFIAKPVLEKELGWDPSTLAFIGSAYLIAYAVGQFIAGAAGNRWGARILVLTGMVVSIGANAAFGFTNSWGAFASFMVLNGLAQATGWSGNVASMAPWFRRGERGTVMGLWATNFQVGGVLANALAAGALGALGFRWSFWTGSVVLMLVWLNFLINQRNRPEDVGLPPLSDEDGPAGIGSAAAATAPSGLGWSRQVVTNVMVVGVFYFFVKFIRYAIWSWAPYLLTQSYGMKADEAGFLSTIFDAAGIVGVIALGWLSDRFFRGRRAKLSFIFILGMTASCGLLYAFGGESLLVFGISMGLIGFTLYGPDAIMTSAGAIDVGSPRGAAMAAGIINGMGALGSVVQELALGKVFESGDVQTVFALLLGSSALAAVFLAVLLLRNRQGKADM